MLIEIDPKFSVTEIKHALSKIGELKPFVTDSSMMYTLTPHSKETIRKRIVAMAEQAAREAE